MVNIFNLIPISIDKVLDNIIIIVWGTVLGYLFGQILNWSKTQKILDKFKIRRTLNSNIWADLMDKDYPMIMQIKIGDAVYKGKVHLIEENTFNPKIALAEYSFNNKIQENNKIIVLDISKASDIVIEYDKDSPMVTLIKFD